MKRFLLTIVLVLVLPVQMYGQNLDVPGFSDTEANAAQAIGISGPTEAKVNDEVTLRLTGTPALDLSKPLIDQLNWLMSESDRMFCFVAAPGKALEPLDVRGELVFAPSGATMQPLVRFVTSVPGEYRLLVDWNYEQNQLVEHVVKVGVNPQPDPDPNPPPPPLPVKNLTVLVVEETSQRTADQFRTLSYPPLIEWLKKYEHKLRIVDKDIVDENNNVPDDLVPWLNQAKELPHVFFIDGNKKLLYQCVLPANGKDFLNLSRMYGAEDEYYD